MLPTVGTLSVSVEGCADARPAVGVARSTWRCVVAAVLPSRVIRDVVRDAMRVRYGYGCVSRLCDIDKSSSSVHLIWHAAWATSHRLEVS